MEGESNNSDQLLSEEDVKEVDERLAKMNLSGDDAEQVRKALLYLYTLLTEKKKTALEKERADAFSDLLEGKYFTPVSKVWKSKSCSFSGKFGTISGRMNDEKKMEASQMLS